MKKSLLLSFILALALVFQAWAQNRTVTGRVTDQSSGQGLPGVTVVVKGNPTIGASTGVDGSFTINNVPSNANTLIISYIGYETQEVAIGADNTVRVSLGVDAEQLAEVVIQVPYGSTTKTAFTGAESTITTKSIEKQNVTSVTRALQGVAPGIQVTNGGGQPGTSAAVRIRGLGSIYSSSAPLYVVDGVPFDGTLASISNDDIASVSILKDAAAAALYGSRAANGVIMITTKRGKKGAPKITFNLRSGLSDRAIPEYDRVNQQEYYELTWEAARNSYVTLKNPATGVKYTPTEAGLLASQQLTGPDVLNYSSYKVPTGEYLVDPATGQLNPNAEQLWNDDWQKELFRTASRQDMNMNVSGGAEKSDYFLSVGYINEKGIVKHSDYDRFSARLNVNTEVKEWLKGGLNLSGALSDQDGFGADGTATSNPFYFTRMMGPIYPIWQRDADGNFILDSGTNERVLDWGKPEQMGTRPYAGNSNLVGSLALDVTNTKRVEAIANTFLEARFLKDFTFRTTLGTNIYNSYSTDYQNSQFGDADNVRGRSTKGHLRQLSYTFNQVLTWEKQLGEHNFRVLAGHENYLLQTNSISATRTGFPFPGVTELGNAAVVSDAGSSENNHRIEGYFSQINYNLGEKYLASASFRRDGSSRFYEDARWGNFWSVGAGWRLSEENFLTADWVNELKLRASYGEQGNEAIDTYYGWQGLYGLGWNNVGEPGALVESLENRELQWETNASVNVGMDFVLFNKLEGTVEWYNRESSNLLFFVPVPLSTGGRLEGIWQNIGTMYNRGIEVQLGLNAITTSNFDWRIDVNATQYKNEITKMPEEQQEIISGTKRYAEGRSMMDFYLREYAGVDPATGDPLYYKDVLDEETGEPTGERVTTSVWADGTQYYVGSAIPDLVGGITNSFRYKNFDMSVLLTYQLGGDFYDSNYAGLMHRGSYGTHWHTDILNRWQQPGDVTDVPRLQNAVAGQDGASDRWLFDATHASLKNINLGYTLPETFVGKAGFGGVRAFVSVDNALFFNSRKGMDPGINFSGTSGYTYVPYRTYTFGLNVNL